MLCALEVAEVNVGAYFLFPEPMEWHLGLYVLSLVICFIVSLTKLEQLKFDGFGCHAQ